MYDILDRTITFVDIDDPIVKAKLSVLDMVPTPCIIMTENREIVWYNHTFYEKFHNVFSNIEGETMAIMMGCVPSKSSSDVFNSSQCEDCPIFIAQNLLANGHKSEQHGTVHVPVPWGKHEIYLDLTAEFIELDSQRYILMSVISRDEQIIHYQMNREFYHDLLNLLQRMRSSLNLANMIIEDTKKEGFHLPNQLLTELNMMNRAITFASDLIGTQRLLHNAQTSTLVLNEATFTPTQLLQQLIQTVEKLDASNGRYIVVVPGRTDVICEGDNVLIKQVCYSLLYILIFVSRSGQFIEVGYDIIDEKLQFYFRNRELVVNEKKMQQFRSEYTFRRLRNTHAFTIELLAIKQLKGSIDITSEVNHGTTLTFTLPANPQPAN